MQSRLVFGALALATTLLAACGSSTASTTTAPGPAPAASSTSLTSESPMPGSVSTTSIDSSMPDAGTASTAASMPMGTDSMGTAPMATDSMGTAPMGTDSMATMDMGGSDSGTQGLSLQVATTGLTSNQPTTLAFKVVAADGSAVTQFKVEQTKELHLILVRSDLSSYRHIHPSLASDGTWTVSVTFPKGGSYRMVADFVPILGGAATARVAITTDLTVKGGGVDTVLPAPSTTATVDGYTVQLAGLMSSATESTLTFTVMSSAGKRVVLEPYLGAFGHLVAFAKSDLAYTHIHPNSADQNNGMLTFLGQVAAPGAHRLFMQFAAAGKVHTAEFTILAT